ncbi:MAG TPA: nuclear transport factor 2 family protein, partial [Polyangiales bacterium]
EIAEALGRSEAACRKLLSRARVHLEERRDAQPAPAERQLAVASAFFQALGSGDLNQVVKLLADDVATTTDHGGKVSAAQNSLLGPDRVARFFLGLFGKARQAPFQVAWESAYVNGAPALIVKVAGAVQNAIVLRITGQAEAARVSHIHVVRNPDKLAAIQAGATLA